MTTQQRLDERYGRRTPAQRRRVIVVLALIGAVVAGLLGWSVVANAIDTVDVDTTGFDISDDHSVVVRFQITAPVGREIACVVEAQDTEHGIVGWRVVEYPASTSASHPYVETVPTTAAATTGFVNSCWVS